MKIVPTPARRRALRAEAHHLDPVVMIGNDGVTPAVLHEIDLNLLAHGLIKVRVFSDERAVREGFLQRIVDELDAAAIQHIGKLLVVYRPVPDAEQPDPAAASRPARKRPGIADPRTLRRSTGGSHRGNYMADSRRKKTIEAATGSSRRRPAEAGTGSSRRRPAEATTTASRRGPAEAAAGSSRRRPAAAASESRRSTPSGTSTTDQRRKPAAPAAGSTRRRRTSQP